MANKINEILLMQCNITDASPHLTTGLLVLHLDLYSDFESRFGPMQPRKPAQDTLSQYWENGTLSLFCGKSKFVAEQTL